MLRLKVSFRDTMDMIVESGVWMPRTTIMRCVHVSKVKSIGKNMP
jgi:hypothetical protein